MRKTLILVAAMLTLTGCMAYNITLTEIRHMEEKCPDGVSHIDTGTAVLGVKMGDIVFTCMNGDRYRIMQIGSIYRVVQNRNVEK